MSKPAQLSKFAQDCSAWSMNIFSSVAIVMVNKQLMSSTGYQFRFATTLCGLHFFCTAFINLCVKRENASAVAVVIGSSAGSTSNHASNSNSNSSQGDVGSVQSTAALDAEAATKERSAARDPMMKIPLKDLVIYVVIANMSIIGLNISLMMNAIGFYQVCKLAQIPTMCILEATFLQKRFSRKVVQAIMIVLLGVAVATVSDVEMNFAGTCAAMIGVLSTSAQQILVGHLQKKHNITSNFLLAKTSLWMAASMLVFGPVMDTLVTQGENVFEYEWSSGALIFLAVSCALAVLVNISQYLCIGRFSAVSFQVIGHIKTVLVFLFGFICFNAPITSKNIAGCALAVVGMIYYTQAMNKQKEEEAKSMTTSSSSLQNLASKV